MQWQTPSSQATVGRLPQRYKYRYHVILYGGVHLTGASLREKGKARSGTPLIICRPQPLCICYKNCWEWPRLSLKMRFRRFCHPAEKLENNRILGLADSQIQSGLKEDKPGQCQTPKTIADIGNLLSFLPLVTQLVCLLMRAVLRVTLRTASAHWFKACVEFVWTGLLWVAVWSVWLYAWVDFSIFLSWAGFSSVCLHPVCVGTCPFWTSCDSLVLVRWPLMEALAVFLIIQFWINFWICR
jgi:hypothetical protein